MFTNKIVLCFLAQDGRTEDADKKAISFTLEENEMKIMRDLTKRAMEK